MNFYVKKLQGRRNSLEGTKRRNSMFERLSSLVKFLQENFIHTRLSRNTRTKEKNFSKEKILHRGTRFFRSRSKCRESFRKRQWPLKRIFLTSSSSNEWKNGVQSSLAEQLLHCRSIHRPILRRSLFPTMKRGNWKTFPAFPVCVETRRRAWEKQTYFTIKNIETRTCGNFLKPNVSYNRNDISKNLYIFSEILQRLTWRKIIFSRSVQELLWATANITRILLTLCKRSMVNSILHIITAIKVCQHKFDE